VTSSELADTLAITIVRTRYRDFRGTVVTSESEVTDALPELAEAMVTTRVGTSIGECARDEDGLAHQAGEALVAQTLVGLAYTMQRALHVVSIETREAL